MLRNIFIAAFRKISRSKASTAINILGLTLGILVSIVIYTMLDFTLGYDKHESNYDHIYRIVHQTESNGNVVFGNAVPVPYYEAFKTDFDGLFDQVVFVSESYGNRMSVVLDGNEKVFNESNGVFYSESSFFDIFDRKIIQGSEQLNEPNTALLSKEWITRFFGDKDPIDQTINLNGVDYKITGVLEDFRPNTDFPFQFIASYETIRKEKEARGWNSVYSGDQIYLLISDHQKLAALEEKFPPFIEKNFGEENARTYKSFLQPLATIHFDDRFDGFSYNTTSKSVIVAFMAIGFFMILTACINFINLTTAMALKRTKEIGVRKIMGGSKWHVAGIFWSETFIITLLSVLVALVLSDPSIQFLNQQFNLSISLAYLGYGKLVLFLLALIVIIVSISSSYPSWILSKISPVISAQNFFTNKASGSYNVRKGLIVIQFIIAQFFIISTLVLLKQIDFVKSMDMGFTKEGILNISPNRPFRDKMPLLKEQIKTMSGVENATLLNSNPASGNISVTDISIPGTDISYNAGVKMGDEDYISTYGIELIHGQNLVPSDTINGVLINQRLATMLGYEDPSDAIGQTLRFWRRDVPIMGVVKDFNTRSLREDLMPTIIVSHKPNYGMLSIKVSSKQLRQTTDAIVALVKEQIPESEFSYRYAQDEINEFYQGEQNMISLVSIFSMVVVIIGCLGLYGLVTFMVNIKMKEMSIRKVLGASSQQIVLLFTREYAILILIGFIIAAPLAGWVMNQWMQNYAFKTNVGAEVYALGLGIVGVLALLTVLGKSIKAALANPVDSLKSE